MLNLSKSNPSTSTPPPPSGPVVSPPTIRPEDFEEYPAFREVFMVMFTDARANAAMRSFGMLLHELVLEFWGHWPNHPEGLFSAEMRSAVADLRCVEGALLEWTGPGNPVDNEHERRIAEVAAEVARGIGKLATRLEVELDSWQGGVS
jgi:hypothetical protein